jgi:hypothetical protein
MPFKSKAQRRWMHARKPKMANRWEEHTPKGKKLPERVKKKKKNSSESIEAKLDRALSEAASSARGANVFTLALQVKARSQNTPYQLPFTIITKGGQYEFWSDQIGGALPGHIQVLHNGDIANIKQSGIQRVVDADGKVIYTKDRGFVDSKAPLGPPPPKPRRAKGIAPPRR